MTYAINQQGHTVQGATKKGASLNLSIVTRIKDRKHHLLETLPTWLKLPVQEIVIVDWDSEDGNLADYLNYIKDERITVVRVNGKQDFDRSRAWNVGINHAAAEWAMLLDCDVKVKPTALSDAIFTIDNDRNFFRLYSDNSAPYMFGSAIVSKDQWRDVGGFNETFEGWGWEDVDFYGRLAQKYREITLSLNDYEPIYHADDERTSFHHEKNLKISVAKNAYRARNVRAITLDTQDDCDILKLSVRVRATHHVQRVDYKLPTEQMEGVMNSPEFKVLVKKFNVFSHPTSVTKLFEMDEFKALEAKHQPPPSKRK